MFMLSDGKNFLHKKVYMAPQWGHLIDSVEGSWHISYIDERIIFKCSFCLEHCKSLIFSFSVVLAILG